MTNVSPLLSVQAVSERLGVSRPVLYGLMHRGELGWVQVAGRRKIPAGALDNYLTKNSHNIQTEENK